MIVGASDRETVRNGWNTPISSSTSERPLRPLVEENPSPCLLSDVVPKKVPSRRTGNVVSDVLRQKDGLCVPLVREPRTMFFLGGGIRKIHRLGKGKQSVCGRMRHWTYVCT